ncbi:MAG: MerR family transcriptional regulator [Alphaproteobacteria bacterium]|nr:MerR family transcriptional regulator [Alphaproteobacteria bacterium]
MKSAVVPSESPRAVAGGKSAGAFRTISEVADDLDVQQHVLRFWETRFSQVRPLKRGGGRRYYRPEDVDLLRTIHHLLYTEGYTIKGVQKLLREDGKAKVIQDSRPPVVSSPAPEPAKSRAASSVVAQSSPPPAVKGLGENQKRKLREALEDLRSLRALIQAR